MNTLLDVIHKIITQNGKGDEYEKREELSLEIPGQEDTPLVLSVFFLTKGEIIFCIGTVVYRDDGGDVFDPHITLTSTGKIVQVRQLYADWYTPCDEHGTINPQIKEQAEAFAQGYADVICRKYGEETR